MTAPVSVSAAIDIDAPVRETFALAAGARTSEFIRSKGLIPGVASVNGDWRKAGDLRVLTLTDGSTLHEELTALTPERAFSYRATGFSGPLGALVAEGRGAWTFEPTSPARIVWTYTFEPKSALAAPLVALIANTLWPGYMRAALIRLKAQAEKEKAA